MVVYTIRTVGKTRAAPRGSLTLGLVVDMDGTAVDAAGDRPYGIVLDDIPTDVPPDMLTLYGEGTEFEDDTMDGVTIGNPVYSDGDGTYSVTEPSGAAGTRVWILGHVKAIDTVSTDVGCIIELEPDFYEKGA